MQEKWSTFSIPVSHTLILHAIKYDSLLNRFEKKKRFQTNSSFKTLYQHPKIVLRSAKKNKVT